MNCLITFHQYKSELFYLFLSFFLNVSFFFQPHSPDGCLGFCFYVWQKVRHRPWGVSLCDLLGSLKQKGLSVCECKILAPLRQLSLVVSTLEEFFTPNKLMGSQIWRLTSLFIAISDALRFIYAYLELMCRKLSERVKWERDLFFELLFFYMEEIFIAFMSVLLSYKLSAESFNFFLSFSSLLKCYFHVLLIKTLVIFSYYWNSALSIAYA